MVASPATAMSTLTVPIYGPGGCDTVLMESAVEVWSGEGVVIVATAMTPIAGLHGDYAENGITPTDLAVTVGDAIVTDGKIAGVDIGALAVASAVPHRDTTFLATTVRNRTGATRVASPVHVNTLCTGGASAIHEVVRRIVANPEMAGIAIGTDDQSVGMIGFENNQAFRAILGEVLGRRPPMHFELGPKPQGKIPPEAFLRAVEIYIARHGVTPESVSDGVRVSFNDTTDPEIGAMWDTAANIARAYGFTTAEAAEIAAESHRRAIAAQDRGVLDGLFVTVLGSDLKSHQNPKRGATPAEMTRGETAAGVTSQSSSKMGGAAAAVALMSASKAKESSARVLAQIVGYSFSAVPADHMGLGPISATRGLLQYLGLTMEQMGHIELNEAFAAVVDAFLKQPDFGLVHGAENALYDERVNPWGGAIATGHVMGAKFLEMVTLGTRFFELNPDKEYMLVTLCGGGGQGAAMVLRNPRFVEGVRRSEKIRGEVGILDQIPAREGGAAPAVSPWGAGRPRWGLFNLMRERGYLSTQAVFDAVDWAVGEVEKTGRALPTATDLDFVLSQVAPATLPPRELMRRALDLVTLLTPADSETLPANPKPLGVVGAGEMGYQLAYDYARAGTIVYLSDVDEATAQTGRANIAHLIYDAAVNKGIYSPTEAARILSRIRIPRDGKMVNAIADLRGDAHGDGGEGQQEAREFEMIIEAATENPAVKNIIFAELRRALGETTTILATNSSSITAEQAGADVVFHYFNPLHAMAIIDGSLRDSLDAAPRAAIMARLRAIATDQRKVFYPIGKDAAGSLVNPLFVATYLAAEMVPEVEDDILRAAGALPAVQGNAAGRTQLEELRDNPRPYAVAMMDALYVEALRGDPTGETRPLVDVLSKELDLSDKGALGALLRSKAQGLFLLVDNTGGPATYVHCADNVAASPVYGQAFRAPEVLRGQAAEWTQVQARETAAGRPPRPPRFALSSADRSVTHDGGRTWSQRPAPQLVVLPQAQAGERLRMWYPEGISNFEYDKLVRGRIATLQNTIGPTFVRLIREKFHRRYWARVMGLMGRMFDAGLVDDSHAYQIENATALGLGWNNTPLRWLRAQGDMQFVRDLIASEGLPVPAFFNRTLDQLPVHFPLLITQQGSMTNIAVNRPGKANAIDQSTVAALADAARSVSADPAISTIVLTGEGKNFVGGADIMWFFARQKEYREAQEAEKSALEQAVAQRTSAIKVLQQALDAIASGPAGKAWEFFRGGDVSRKRANVEKAEAAVKEVLTRISAPLAKIYDDFSSHEVEAMRLLRDDGRLLIVVVQGKNVGGGAEITAQGDLTIALDAFEGQGTEFWFPEASLGIGVGYGGHVELAKRVGRGLALRYLLTGAHFKTQEALESGYLNRSVRRQDLGSTLAQINAEWDALRAGIKAEGGDDVAVKLAAAKAEFIVRWSAPRDPGERLSALRRLWEDPFNAEMMALGQVPPWLTGAELRLAQREVAMIRKASPQAIRLLYTMVEQGPAADLRGGLTAIFATPEAQGAIGKFARERNAVPYLWPTDVDLRDDIRRISTARNEALESAAFEAVIGEFVKGESDRPGPG